MKLIRKHIWIDDELNFWLKGRAAIRGHSFSEEVRIQLKLAKKYEHAIRIKEVQRVNSL